MWSFFYRAFPIGQLRAAAAVATAFDPAFLVGHLRAAAAVASAAADEGWRRRRGGP